MNKIKVIEQAREVYWATTYQGKWEVDGEEVEFRYSEDSNGSSLYVFRDGKWEESLGFGEDSVEGVIHSMCSEMNPGEWGDSGDNFVYDQDEFI